MLQHIVPYTNIATAQDQFSNRHYLICAYIYHFYIKGVEVHIVIHIVISWWSVLSQRSPYIHLYPSEVITRQFFSPPSYSHSFSHCLSSPSYHSHGYLHCSQASMKGHPWHNICSFTLYISPFHIGVLVPRIVHAQEAVFYCCACSHSHPCTCLQCPSIILTHLINCPPISEICAFYSEQDHWEKDHWKLIH